MRSCRRAGAQYTLRLRLPRRQAQEPLRLEPCRCAKMPEPALRACEFLAKPSTTFVRLRDWKVRHQWRAKISCQASRMKIQRSAPVGRKVWFCGRPCRRVSESVHCIAEKVEPAVKREHRDICDRNSKDENCVLRNAGLIFGHRFQHECE